MTSSRLLQLNGRPAALAIGFGLLLSGCGGHTSSATSAAQTSTATTRTQSAFAWLAPQTVPPSWRVVRIPTGAAMAYPPTWRRIAGDPGTATAVLRDEDGAIVGYLNATPRQGAETTSNWASFRTDHNAEEGDRHIIRLAAATGLRFRTGHGTCVRDSYVTGAGASYIELACLVAGQRATTVIVGAASPRHWSQIAPSLERAISAFAT